MARSADQWCPNTSLPHFLGWRLTKGSRRISKEVLAYRRHLGSACKKLCESPGSPFQMVYELQTALELQPWGGTLIFLNSCSALLRFYMGWFVKGGWAPSRNIFDSTSRCEFLLAFTSFIQSQHEIWHIQEVFIWKTSEIAATFSKYCIVPWSLGGRHARRMQGIWQTYVDMF